MPFSVSGLERLRIEKVSLRVASLVFGLENTFELGISDRSEDFHTSPTILRLMKSASGNCACTHRYLGVCDPFIDESEVTMVIVFTASKSRVYDRKLSENEPMSDIEKVVLDYVSRMKSALTVIAKKLDDVHARLSSKDMIGASFPEKPLHSGESFSFVGAVDSVRGYAMVVPQMLFDAIQLQYLSVGRIGVTLTGDYEDTYYRMKAYCDSKNIPLVNGIPLSNRVRGLIEGLPLPVSLVDAVFTGMEKLDDE